jgi:hypothetical protein
VTEHLVNLSRGRTVPHGLYASSRCLVRLYWVTVISPFIVLVLMSSLSTSEMLSLAELVNNLVWAGIKQISLEACTENCWARAYTLVAVPISWAATLLFALAAIPSSVLVFRANEEALRRGAAPYGVLANKPIDGLPSWKFVAFGLLAWIVTGATLWFLADFSIAAAGSNWGLSRGRTITPPVMSFLLTAIVALIQICAVALAASATTLFLNFMKISRI